MRQGHGAFSFLKSGVRRARLPVFGIAAIVVASSGMVIGTVGTPSGASSKVSAGSVSAALAYTGGTSGPANSKKSPISIGWVSDETAITGHAGNTAGVKAAVALINNNLGGLAGGHPLKLVPCYITTSDSQGAQCAQQMLNNPAVKVVAEGELLTGEASFIGTMAGAKPVVGVFNSPGVTTMNAFYLDGAIQGELASVPYMAKQLDAKTVAVLGPNLPGVAAALGMFKALFGALGVNATVVLYPGSSTDLEAPIAASGAQSADAIFLVSSTSGECVAVAKAFTQLGITKPVVSLPACLETAVKTGLGDYPKWTYVYTSLNPSAPHSAKSTTAAFLAAMNAYSNPKLENSGYAPLTFGTILTLAQWINQLGASGFTSAAIAAKAAAFTGPMFMGDPQIKFGVPPFTALGSIRALFYSYKGHGKFAETTGGKWLCPPIPTCT